MYETGFYPPTHDYSNVIRFVSQSSLPFPKSSRQLRKAPLHHFPKYTENTYNRISYPHITIFSQTPHKQTITPNPHARPVPNAHPSSSSSPPTSPRAPAAPRSPTPVIARCDGKNSFAPHARRRCDETPSTTSRRRVEWGVVADATASLAARKERARGVGNEEEPRRGTHPRVRSSEVYRWVYFFFFFSSPPASSHTTVDPRRRVRVALSNSRDTTLFLARFTQPSPTHSRRVSHHPSTDVSPSRSRASTHSIFSSSSRTHLVSSSRRLCRDPRPDSFAASLANQTRRARLALVSAPRTAAGVLLVGAVTWFFYIYISV